MTTPPVSPSGPDAAFPVARARDVVLVQMAARGLARSLGFGKQAEWEVAISVSEAATNILKFAGSGEIRLRVLREPEVWLEFEAVDSGPGISDLALALEEGYSEGEYTKNLVAPALARGLGSGLAAVGRLMDRMHLANRAEGGVVLVAAKALRETGPARRPGQAPGCGGFRKSG